MACWMRARLCSSSSSFAAVTFEVSSLFEDRGDCWPATEADKYTVSEDSGHPTVAAHCSVVGFAVILGLSSSLLTVGSLDVFRDETSPPEDVTLLVDACCFDNFLC